MAKLVAAATVPHGPMLTQQVAQAPGLLKTEAIMNEVRVRLEAASPLAYLDSHNLFPREAAND